MKLDEIIQTDMRYKTSKDKFGDGFADHDNPAETTGSPIGAGVYYNAYSKTDNPHEIDKLSKRSTKGIDAQAAYFKALVNNDLTGHNIFAPRIYGFEEITDDNGKHHHKFNTETLLQARDVSFDEAMVVCRQIFDESDIATLLRYAQDVDKKSGKFLTGMMGDNFRDQAWEAGKITTNSKELNVILQVVVDLQRSGHNYFYDLHAGNLMYRRTASGIQLVINDPLGGG
jgi:hypothetical protein